MLPAKASALFSKPSRRYLTLRHVDEVRKGMMIDGPLGVMRFVRVVENGEIYTNPDGVKFEINNRWGNKWWVEDTASGSMTMCCLDLGPPFLEKMKFFTYGI